MIVGILKEPQAETRVSLLPEAAAQLIKKGIEIFIETGAGLKASASDADYEKAGAKLVSAQEVVSSADVILSIHQPALPIPASKVLIGVFQPLYHQVKMQQWAQQGITVFSMDMLPRTTRAQSMDVLSSPGKYCGIQSCAAGGKFVSEIFSHVHDSGR